jgi:Chaperone of endosialidase
MDALYSNQTGISNTAAGSHALYKNTASYNTAVGYTALSGNVAGVENSAFGLGALSQGTDGSYNTAVGSGALLWNNGGNYNTAIGLVALDSNTSGSYNMASGTDALASNTYGNSNAALGYSALYSNNSGSVNVAVGQNALFSNVSGGNNIAIGSMSGYDITGSNNIDIGSMGASGESGIIRIGTKGTQTKVFIAGIEATKITGNAVYVTASGELGVLASSERYKNAIETMGSDTEKLMRLRPVTFHLKTEPNGAVQYGLIAEEVDKIYPELVIRDEAGQIQGVRYDELSPMLLNVVQKQQQKLAAQDAAIEAQTTDIRAMKLQFAELAKQNRELAAALSQASAQDARLAMR